MKLMYYDSFACSNSTILKTQYIKNLALRRDFYLFANHF